MGYFTNAFWDAERIIKTDRPTFNWPFKPSMSSGKSEASEADVDDWPRHAVITTMKYRINLPAHNPKYILLVRFGYHYGVKVMIFRDAKLYQLIEDSLLGNEFVEEVE